MMKIIFLLALLATMCTAFGQGKTPPPPMKPPAQYVEDYIKENMKKPTPQGEFETKSEWEERVRKEKDKQRKELMNKALYKLYGSPFEKKVNLRLGQYNIEHVYFPIETNGLGSYVLPVDREDGPKWRASWNDGKFLITYTYGLVNGKPRLVSLTAKCLEYNLGEQEVYPIDEETGKFTEFVWRNGIWETGRRSTELIWNLNSWRIPEKDREEEEKYGNEIFRKEKIDQEPQFNGNMKQWLKDNLKYPVIAQENGISGKVYVTFIVETDGSITDVRVTRSVDPSLDKEAVRVVRAMPIWKPGKIDGIPVRVAYTIPINFSLSN